MIRFNALIVALLSLVVQGAWAQTVNYIYYTADEGTHVVTKHTDGSVTDYTVLDASKYQLESGWYVVNSDISYKNRLQIKDNADVKIILCDNTTVAAPRGIKVNTTATLTIYAQSEGNDVGMLTATTDIQDWAAIGGEHDYQAGIVRIHGGDIIARSTNKRGAGIGGGYGDGSGMKEITIYGGNITAQGANNGAGIGAAKNNKKGKINIYGGTIYTTGGKYAAGIGGAENRGGWDTNIYGGAITAQGGDSGAGIGGGYDGDGGNITIYGCERLTARGGTDAAAIGGGENADGGTLEIFGGNIEASGGKAAASIGGGNCTGIFLKGGSGGNIKIHGGKILARYDTDLRAGSWAAAIGGGYNSDGGTIVIDGGEVEAQSAFNYSLDDYSAAIGCGLRGYGGSVTITGDAVVKVYITVFSTTIEKSGYLIGASDARNKKGALILGDNHKVTDVYHNPNTTYKAGERVSQSLHRQTSLRIEPCDHAECTYSNVTESQHTAQCKHCKYKVTEEHQVISPSTQCDKCGYGEGVTLRTLAFPQTSTASVEGYSSAGFDAVQGQTIALPECTTIPSGYEFAGWLMQNDTPASIEAADDETLLQPDDSYTVDGNATFFARYRYDFTETWTWNDDLSSATLRLTNQANQFFPTVTVSNRTVQTATADSEGFITATATATYTHGNTTYTFSDTKTVSAYWTYELGEGDNTATLATADGLSGTVQLTGRTLYKDGSWNTLCLPFNLEDGDDSDVLTFSGTPLEGATVKALESATFSAGTLTLNFSDVIRIKAGRPYLIRWDKPDDYTDHESAYDLGPSDLIFNGVTISAENNDEACTVDDDKSVTFCGIYGPKVIDTAGDPTMLYLGAGNKLYCPNGAMTIASQRAYFQLTGLTADNGADARIFVLSFGDGETSGVSAPVLSMSAPRAGSTWYTLDGRRLSSKPTAKGLYINNGMKAVIK